MRISVCVRASFPFGFTGGMRDLIVLVCVRASFPFDFTGGMRDLIVLVPDYCLSIYFGHI